MAKHIFTSESVSEGHPDKVADQISDAVLDACLLQDAESHVACETYTTTGMVLVGGEITTSTYIDIQDLVRDVVRQIGYTKAEYGLDANSMSILNAIHSQSPDINQGVSGSSGLYDGLQGAGDQGMMFGYACSETPQLMPAPIYYAHKLLQKAALLRKGGSLPWLRPDAKSQVSLEYENGKPQRIDSVVLSHQHDEHIEHAAIEQTLIQQVIEDVLEPSGLLDKDTKFYINPTGRFVIGGPHGDAGLTGRKIIVDTYGGMGRHGGGAFSGKDPSKVDRSAAYMARCIAKHVVAAQLAERCEIQLSYAIGVPFPISVLVDTFGTATGNAKFAEEKIASAVQKVFDLSPAGIVATLDLKRPIYFPSASYGHFGRSEFPWEKTDKIAQLQKAVG